MTDRAPARLGVIGCGVMGSQHARVIAESTRAELAGIVDDDVARGEKVGAALGVPAHRAWDPALRWDAAVLATPTEVHLDLALELLAQGIPLLVEKPLTADLVTTREMVATADRLDVPLLCGFVERFNPVVAALEDLLDGDPVHVLTVRHSPRADRIVTSVVHDLLIHDIDLVLRLCGTPASVVASGWRSPETGTAEIADATLQFAGAVATASADRWGQRKVRTVSVSTQTSLVELDLLRQDVTVFRHVRHEALGSANYRAETVIDIPYVRQRGEPLALQLEHFLAVLAGEADAAAERASILPPHEVAAVVESTVSGGGR